MSLLRRIEKRDNPHKLLRRLLETLEEAGALRPQIEALLTAEGPELDEARRAQLEKSPVDFLLNAPALRPQTTPARTVQAAPKPDQPSAEQQARFRELKSQVAARMLADFDPEIVDRAALREQIEERYNTAITAIDQQLLRTERQRLLESILADGFGYGPLEPLLQDESISEILVLGPQTVFITHKGRREKSSLTFEDDRQLLRILNRLLAPLGKRLDEAEPTLFARFPDGSQLTAFISPLAQGGPAFRILKFNRAFLQVEDLIRFGTLHPELAEFLRACVIAGLNILVCGEMSVGKTTLLNMLANFVPASEVSVVIDEMGGVAPRGAFAYFMPRPPDPQGLGGITEEQILQTALHLRPDRLVIGEFKAAETAALMQSSAPWLATLKADSVRDALAHLETICLQSGGHPQAVRRLIASRVDLIVRLGRLRSGTRRVLEVAEVWGIEQEHIILSTLFEFELSLPGVQLEGRLRATGAIPRVRARLEDAGIHLPPSTFSPARFDRLKE